MTLCEGHRRGGLRVDQTRRFDRLEKENGQLTRLLADISSGAYSLGRTDLLAWSAARRVNLSIQFGHTELAPMNYAGYAFATAIPMRRDYHAALSFGAFAAIVGLGQMMVITLGPGNVDLSIPATMTLALRTARPSMM